MIITEQLGLTGGLVIWHELVWDSIFHTNSMFCLTQTCIIFVCCVISNVSHTDVYMTAFLYYIYIY